MTREEAIEILESIDNDEVDEEFVEAYNKAIQSLEQEPCEDAVSRKAVLNTLDTADKFLDEDRTIENYKDFLKECYKVLTPVTPTRKKGKWCKQNDDYFDWYECSECGYGSEGEMQYSSEYDVRTKYCPNCGAEMESEEV